MAQRPSSAHQGEAQRELRRAQTARFEAVLSELVQGGQAWAVLHVRLTPQPRSRTHRFRESDALAWLGFQPWSQCPFFPVGCFFGGCYYRVIGPLATADDRARAEALFEQVVARLDQILDHLVQGARLAEEIGLGVV